MNHHESNGSASTHHGIDHHTAAPPVAIPPGHVGPVTMPGSGRTIWWTGRVAIGLRHQPTRFNEPVTQSSMWIQRLLLGGRRALRTV